MSLRTFVWKHRVIHSPCNAHEKHISGGVNVCGFYPRLALRVLLATVSVFNARCLTFFAQRSSVSYAGSHVGAPPPAALGL